MNKKITAIVIVMTLIFSLFTFNTYAAAETGYWKLVGTGGSTLTSTPDGSWILKEDFTGTNTATFYKHLKGELIHQVTFTWTPLPDKVYPGEVFPFTAIGKVVFHKEPWFTNGSLLFQFYGAMFPQNWTAKDNTSQSVSIDAKVPVGSSDKSKDNHFMRLRLSASGYGNNSTSAANVSGPFQYIYEWTVSPKPNQPQISGSNVILSWSPVDGAKSYNIYRSKISGNYDNTPLTDFPIKETTFTDDKAKSGITYYYSIRPIMNDGKEGIAFTEVSASVQEQKVIVLQIANPFMDVNGVKQEIDPGKGTAPIILSGRTVLPIRAVVEAMGGTVAWDGNQQKVTLSVKGTNVELWIDKNEILVNGQTKEMDVAPTVINGRTMIPVRFAAENLNAEIVWDGDNQKITIKY